MDTCGLQKQPGSELNLLLGLMNFWMFHPLTCFYGYSLLQGTITASGFARQGDFESANKRSDIHAGKKNTRHGHFSLQNSEAFCVALDYM